CERSCGLTDRGSAAGPRRPSARAASRIAKLYQIWEKPWPVSCNLLLGSGARLRDRWPGRPIAVLANVDRLSRCNAPALRLADFAKLSRIEFERRSAILVERGVPKLEKDREMRLRRVVNLHDVATAAPVFVERKGYR